MKHFKYRFNNLLVTKLSSKRYGRRYLTRNLLFALDCLLLVALAVAITLLCKYIGGIETVNGGLRLFLQILVGAHIVILPIAVCILLAAVIEKYFPLYRGKQITKRAIYECAAPLRKFYKIEKSFIVTKCYDCTVTELKNKDLLLFVCDGKLRIVNDLTSTLKDFGCYEISKDELEYGYKLENGLTSTYVKADGIELVLGRRAKPFITRNLFDTPSDKCGS